MQNFFTTSASNLDVEIVDYEKELAMIDWVADEIKSNCAEYRELLT